MTQSAVLRWAPCPMPPMCRVDTMPCQFGVMQNCSAAGRTHFHRGDLQQGSGMPQPIWRQSAANIDQSREELQGTALLQAFLNSCPCHMFIADAGVSIASTPGVTAISRLKSMDLALLPEHALPSTDWLAQALQRCACKGCPVLLLLYCSPCCNDCCGGWNLPQVHSRQHPSAGPAQGAC